MKDYDFRILEKSGKAYSFKCLDKAVRDGKHYVVKIEEPIRRVNDSDFINWEYLVTVDDGIYTKEFAVTQVCSFYKGGAICKWPYLN